MGAIDSARGEAYRESDLLPPVLIPVIDYDVARQSNQVQLMH